MTDRATTSANTFDEAQALARESGMALTNPSSGCYQLRYPARGWLINMYPRHSGCSPRMYHDPHHPGPYLTLPEDWTLLHAVQAACGEDAHLEVQEHHEAMRRCVSATGDAAGA